MSWCRKAVILAAGRGTRLGTLAEEMPKCLLPVGGKAPLDHHLDSLAAAGIQDVTVVVGFEGDRVAAHAAGRCRIVVNDRYETTNSIVSLHLAGAHLRGHAFVMQNADVLYQSRAHPPAARCPAA
ncbi:MAG TPA: NTP transferase domain-containing protein [Gemmatimonadaceae bacterium]|nr:NTP transferase domain-containing protein [Gemmatimonadaceae bacterium]